MTRSEGFEGASVWSTASFDRTHHSLVGDNQATPGQGARLGCAASALARPEGGSPMNQIVRFAGAPVWDSLSL